MQEWHLFVSRGPELENNATRSCLNSTISGCLGKYAKRWQRRKSFRIWSGLSESNRHLNLGKVREDKSNALERRHLAFWGRVLIWKMMENKARSSLYCQNRCSRGLVRVFSETAGHGENFSNTRWRLSRRGVNRWRNSIESRLILLV
jgi:hypothetical protein